ncbi:hypothetical protein DBZ36_09820 [Alginatibacterium sediminis]|uniref:Uncharacterized protein n=1 Tax=Alginatibacterium sediminis TaxID=2164068 RepID=A0A420EDE0_9ALTE|nr:hypothetical protein [Alginatibacterium sediminis]RKF18688.1 hypothetical protein DBZ36_09820 [Alginatibacterium sediminis]
MIKGFIYVFVIPVEIVVLVLLLNNFRKRKLDGIMLLVYFLFMMFLTWFSFNIMAWPTYWFAANNETLYVHGVGYHSDKVGNETYKMYFSRKDDASRYSVPIRSNLYGMYREKCQFTGFPVDSKGWWAGNVVLEKRIIQSISEYCIE